MLGLLHRRRLRSVLASDVEPAAVQLAARNLALLSADGLRARGGELRELEAERGRASYGEAAAAAGRMAARLQTTGGDLRISTARADAFDPVALTQVQPVPSPDLVITDVPYGEQTTWLGNAPDADPLPALARSLCEVLPRHAVIVLTAKARKISLGPGVPALARVRVGARTAFIGRAGQLREAL